MSVLRKYILCKQLKRSCAQTGYHYSTRVISDNSDLRITQCGICGKIAYSISYDPPTRRVHQLPPYWHFKYIEQEVPRAIVKLKSNFGHLFDINNQLTDKATRIHWKKNVIRNRIFSQR